MMSVQCKIYSPQKECSFAIRLQYAIMGKNVGQNFVNMGLCIVNRI